MKKILFLNKIFLFLLFKNFSIILYINVFEIDKHLNIEPKQTNSIVTRKQSQLRLVSKKC